MDEFFALYEGSLINLGKSDLVLIAPFSSTLPIKMSIKKADEGFDISLSDTEYRFIKGKDYEYILIENRIYRVSDEFASVSRAFMDTIALKKKLFVAESDMSQFYNSVVTQVSGFIDTESDGTDLSVYEAAPFVCKIYISEKDIYHGGKAIYPIEKELGGTGLPYDDGVHIFFVNAAVDDGSRIAKLMKYFKTADPDDDSEGELSKRVRYLKREEGGVDIMCEVSERIMERGRKIGEEQGRKEQARSTALNLSQMGLTPEQIAGAVGESLEQVKNWLAGAKPAN